MRTLADSNASGVLAIPGTYPGIGAADDSGGTAPTGAEHRAVTTDGTVLLLVSRDSPAAAALSAAAGEELTAVLEITDVAPVAVPHRIRGRAWIAGWLTPADEEARAEAGRLFADRITAPGTQGLLLRLEPGEAGTDDLWGTGTVEPEELAEARTDPLARHEAGLLQHLAAAHRDQLAALCGFVTGGDGECGGWERMEPLALDRFGIRLRFWRGAGGGFDARLDFSEPVTDVSGLRRALHRLFAGAG